MKCGYAGWIEDDLFVSCTNEATHNWSCEMIGVPVCADHKCRCSITLVEQEAKRAPTPSHWMAT